jgi:nitrile hydratase accessory protein
MADPAGIEPGLEGPIAPPRHNGEIVFGAPWERRLFGLTIALCRCGKCEWEMFRRRLIRRIAQDEARPYWRSWAAALEDVLARSSVVTRAELDVRQRQMLKRPAGHDH